MAKTSASVPLDSLVDLACRNGVDVRPTLLRVLTDLYLQRPSHSAEEETQYVELVQGLIDTVDEQTRAIVVTKLRDYPKAPEALLAKLVAEPAGSLAPGADPELIELFFSASPEERRLIVINLDVTVQPSAPRPMPAASELVRRLELAALRRDPAEFSRVLERALGISRGLAQRITQDSSGEPVVVAAKALGMPAEILQRILLFLNPEIGQSVRRLYELNMFYADINVAAAEHMVSIWRADIVPARRSHEPVYWDDERRGQRAVARQTPSRVTPVRNLQTTRLKINRR
ncbi:MAG TPA: DUF2336 domain-containing protein [Pseudolabrys sp.]|nr:DUF2336 domain-containing protein [Pseudolabrys sp.]